MKKRILAIMLMLLFAVSVFALASCGGGGGDTPAPDNRPEIDGVTFNGATYTYDGTEKSIEVSGLPEGATVTYTTSNKATNAGSYAVNATVKLEGHKDLTVTATLVIEPKEIDIEWTDLGPFASVGEEPEIEYTVVGALDGDEVNANISFGDCDFTEAGDFTFTVTLDNSNYKLKAEDKSVDFEVGGSEHTVTFDLGYGTKDPDVEEVEHNEPVDAPRRNPTRLGYEFVGWYLGDEPWDFDTPITKNITLTAKWRATEYTITYNLNGGVNSPENPATFTLENEKQLAIPTKEGYVFLGWYEDSSFTTPAKAIGSSRKNLVLYAKWSSSEYTALSANNTVNAANSAITLNESAVNGKFVYTFVADIDSFGEDGAIYIGRGKNTVEGSYIKITSGQIFVVTNGINNEIISDSRGHVRTMAGYIVVSVETDGGIATVMLQTGDGISTVDNLNWSGKNGEIFFEAENASFKNATFGWETNAYDQPVWIVGDVNVGTDSDTYWANQLAYHGFGDFLSIGSSSIDSTEAVRLFEESLAIAAPKYAIWSFGTDEANTAENLAKFISVCESKGVTPILTTHAESLDADNAALNATVKSSGKRFIDFEAAAKNSGVIENGAYTRIGAKTLYARVMVDFPEIICTEVVVRSVHADEILSYDSSAGTGVPAAALKMHGNVIKDGKYMVFTAKLDGELKEGQIIKLGHGYRQSSSTWAEITSDKVMAYSYYGYNNPPLANALSGGPRSHGLTIKNYITVVITRDTDDMGSTLAIFTDGGSYLIKKGEGLSWGGETGDMFALADGLNLTDATLHWVCKDYAKDIWIIGDSYLGTGNSSRWPYYMYNAGYQNALMVGYAGMACQAGLDDFKDALQYDKPKYLVWCMGMNNGDKNGVLSTSYVNCTLEVLELCKQHGIEAILSTIPTCIAVENGPKNNEILYRIGRFADYDYRIVDFARAVDGYQPQSSATWYEGMLYSDNVHPDIRGAKALYMQFMHDFPEIIAGCEIDVAENKNETLNADETLTIVPNGPVGEQKVITFTADYSSFSGFSIGNGAGVEGGTWVEITESKVAVYTMQNGVKVELAQEVNSLVMEDLVTVIIHVDGTSAKICVQGTGEKDFESSKTKNVIFNVKSTWSFAGDVFVSAGEGQNFENASLKWYSFDK